jgi:hypothetical protein
MMWSPVDPRIWALVVLAVVMPTFGLRAVVGVVEVTGTDYIVRNLLHTRRIPRHQVTGFTEVSVLWSIQWLTDEAPAPNRRYNAKAIEILRADP